MNRLTYFPLFICVFLASLLVISCQEEPPSDELDLEAAGQPLEITPPEDFRIVGYYRMADLNRDDPADFPFEYLTHVNLAFVNPETDGTYTQDLSNIGPFLEEAHRHDVKVLISIAGGGTHDYYRELLLDENRAGFIDNMMDVVLETGVDGVDVDLEGSAIDENYEAFVVELGERLHQHDLLMTSALAIYYSDQYTQEALDAYDFINVMIYDRTGPWRPDEPGHHSPYQAAVDDIAYFRERWNIPRDRLVSGAPFYGYAFTAGEPNPDQPVRTMTYGEIVDAFPGSQWADQWPIGDGYVIFYNGIPTMINKTIHAKQHAGGIMIWQLGGDHDGEYSLLRKIHEVANSF